MTRSVWRKRRTLKWIGLLLSIMMLGLWVCSVMFVSFYEPPSGQWRFDIACGRIGVDHDVAPFFPGWQFAPVSDVFLVPADMPWTAFAHSYLGFGLPGKAKRAVAVKGDKGIERAVHPVNAVEHGFDQGDRRERSRRDHLSGGYRRQETKFIGHAVSFRWNQGPAGMSCGGATLFGIFSI